MVQNPGIFVVDDDPFWLGLLHKLLNRLGYSNVRCFESGEGCVRNLSQNPAVVFLDYQMEEMNGIETLKRIKKYNQGIFVVLTTGKEDNEVALNAKNQGSYDYILKAKINMEVVEGLLAKIQTNSKVHPVNSHPSN